MKISLNHPNGFPTQYGPDPHKYIDSPPSTTTTSSNSTPSSYHIPVLEHKKNRFNPYNLNYGTVVGVAGADFVVVAGDTRLSEGYSIVTRN